MLFQHLNQICFEASNIIVGQVKTFLCLIHIQGFGQKTAKTGSVTTVHLFDIKAYLCPDLGPSGVAGVSGAIVKENGFE